MKDFTQEELKKLLYQNQYNNSYSKYNSNEFIGKEILGVKILCFVSANKEIGIDYPSFICKCFCGKLFLRGCQLILKSNNISCGHCNDEIKRILAPYKSLINIPQDILKSVLISPVYIIDKSKYSEVTKGTIIEHTQILKYLPSTNNFGPCYICKCLYCNKLFLAPASHVIKGMYKTCGSFKCNRLRINDEKLSYRYTENNKKEFLDLTVNEKEEMIEKMNSKYKNEIKGDDLFLKAIKVSRTKGGYVSYRILVMCQKCKKEK